jgi:hypothetical protein
MSSNVRQKDPCPCGSGKRYKNCCGKRGAKSSFRKWTGLKLSVLAIVVVGGGAVAYMIFSKPTITPLEVITTETPPKSVQPLQPQPVDPAGEGKVWSTEHGHWHDAPGAATSSGSATNPITITPGATPGSGTNPISITPGTTPGSGGELTPQPPGPAPEGKVWSSEHGHWHNAPGAATPSGSGTNPISIAPGATPESGGELTPQPPGPAPEGKVWSPEHGHWHNAPGTTRLARGHHRDRGQIRSTLPPTNLPKPEAKIRSDIKSHSCVSSRSKPLWFRLLFFVIVRYGDLFLVETARVSTYSW